MPQKPNLVALMLWHFCQVCCKRSLLSSNN